MGRTKILTERVQILIRINKSLDKRLETYRSEFGLTKNSMIEQAIASWLNRRDSEAK